MGTSGTQIQDALATSRLTVPTLAISGGVVGDAIHAQLVPYADDLAHASVPDCGHLVPLEQPEALTATLTPFLAGVTTPGL
jgi:pimeloyl-ACP methyl ester carboxylesterase